MTEDRTAKNHLETRTAQLSRQARQLRQLTWSLTLAEERERRRVADVLHDNQQQLLAAAKLPLVSLASATDEAVRQAAAKTEALIDQAIDCARELTEELCPPILYHGGLLKAMEWLADWKWEKHGLKIRLDMHPDAEPEMENTRVLLFRCARELLFIAVKHAGVKEVEVRLRDHNGKTEVMVSDQGRGFDPEDLERQAETGRGFGLFAVRERMELLGGKLDIESAPGQGSRFTLLAPRTALTSPESTAAIP